MHAASAGVIEKNGASNAAILYLTKWACLTLSYRTVSESVGMFGLRVVTTDCTSSVLVGMVEGIEVVAVAGDVT